MPIKEGSHSLESVYVSTLEDEITARCRILNLGRMRALKMRYF